MQTRFQMSIGRERTHAASCVSNSRLVLIDLRFVTDSKTLSRLEQSRVRKNLVNGLERASSEVPAKLRVFHSKAARRDL
jgi:hypothetical protein